VVPPGVKGTTMRIGFDGYEIGCACKTLENKIPNKNRLICFTIPKLL
jgi:hypothetical protein